MRKRLGRVSVCAMNRVNFDTQLIAWVPWFRKVDAILRKTIPGSRLAWNHAIKPGGAVCVVRRYHVTCAAGNGLHRDLHAIVPMWHPSVVCYSDETGHVDPLDFGVVMELKKTSLVGTRWVALMQREEIEREEKVELEAALRREEVAG